MERCIKCGGTLPADAKVCPYCGNPVSLYEEKMQPVQSASRKQARWRTILILAVVVLSGLLIASLVFAIMLWTAPAKLVVSPGSLDYGTLQVGSQGSQVLTLNNSGRQDLNWSADKGKADWLTLDPSQGRIPSGGSQTINLRADTTLLIAGRYSASISFSSNGGQASVSAVLIVTSAPSGVSSISPTSGPATGGTTVTITGSGFTGASKVLFGTVAASDFTVNSDTQITAVSPAGSGTVHVTVITPGGTSATSTADRFTYVVVPTVTSISPTSGPATGGTKVTISGKGLTGASKVLFGTVAASSVTLNSDTQITAVSPAGSGTVHVTVITPGGTSATSTADRFTYVPAPTVTNISPTSGPATGGTKVTVSGKGLTGASKVLFGTVAASSVTLNSDTQITAVSPAGSGTVDVKVTTPGGTSATSTADRFTYVPVPTITSISPRSGPVAGGTVVIIRGSGFTGASKVLFGPTASSFLVNSDTQITTYSPAGSGTVHVTVTTLKGTSATSTADQFTYVPVPTIASISPTSGPVAGGTTVTIKGSGFTEVSQVRFGTTVSIFTVNSSTQITVISPTSPAGTVDVTVTTPGGTSATSIADQFTYRVAPTVTGISPTSGPAAGGMFVTITGSDFTGASQVRFGTVAVAASNFTVKSDTQITVFSPAGSGTVDVKVTTPGGTSATSNADKFTYVPVPIVTSISPNTGPATGGTPVTITGSGFTDASQVRFGTVAVAASDFTVNSTGTQITVNSPASPAGPVHVTVTTPVGGTSATSNADLFQYA
jgi:IPT/TIG domain-containing protein/BACON domain-containing protein